MPKGTSINIPFGKNLNHSDGVNLVSKPKHLGVADADEDFYLDNVNYLGNLQLLERIPDIEKSDQLFEAWLAKQFPEAKARDSYCQKHYIPNTFLAFTNFETFFTAREALLANALKKALTLYQE